MFNNHELVVYFRFQGHSSLKKSLWGRKKNCGKILQSSVITERILFLFDEKFVGN